MFRRVYIIISLCKDPLSDARFIVKAVCRFVHAGNLHIIIVKVRV